MEVVYRSWSADPAAELRALRNALDTELFGLDIAPRGSSTSVEAVFGPHTLDDLHVARYSGTPITAYRTYRQIRRTPRDEYLVALQLRGAARLAQSGRRLELRPGDLTVIDAGETYTMELAGTTAYELLTVRVPRDRLTGGRRPSVGLNAVRVPADSAPGRLLAPYFQTLGRTDWTAGDLTGRFIDTGLDLLTGTLEEIVTRDTPDARMPGLLQVALRETRRRISDPDLSAPRIAAATHISVRQLHRLFATAGLTFGQWLRHERLRLCHLDLRDQAMTHVPIAEIGHRWGYRDPAHFSRAFSQRYGASPRTLRSESESQRRKLS